MQKRTAGRRKTISKPDSRLDALHCPAPLTLFNIAATWAHWPMRAFLLLLGQSDNTGLVGADRGGVTRQALAELAGCNQGTARMAVGSLIAAGWVRVSRRTAFGTIFEIKFPDAHPNANHLPARATPTLHHALCKPEPAEAPPGARLSKVNTGAPARAPSPGARSPKVNTGAPARAPSPGARFAEDSPQSEALPGARSAPTETSIGFKTKPTPTPVDASAVFGGGADQVTDEGTRTERMKRPARSGAPGDLSKWRGNSPGPTALDLGQDHPLIVALAEAGIPDDEIAWKLSAHTAGHVAAAYLASWFNAFDPAAEIHGPPNRGRLVQAIQNHAGGWKLEAVRAAIAAAPARFRINEPTRSKLAHLATVEIVAQALSLTKKRDAASLNGRNPIRNPAGVVKHLIQSGEAFSILLDDLKARYERHTAGGPERTRLAIAAAPVVTDSAACEYRIKIQDIPDAALAELWDKVIAQFSPGTLERRNYSRVMFKGAQLRESIVASKNARALLDAVLNAGTAGGKVL